MKYICTIDGEEEEEIFLFPASVDHDVFAEELKAMRNQTWGNWRRVIRHIVSAGFVEKDLTCHGKSETLGVDSRGGPDTLLLKKQLSL